MKDNETRYSRGIAVGDIIYFRTHQLTSLSHISLDFIPIFSASLLS